MPHDKRRDTSPRAPIKPVHVAPTDAARLHRDHDFIRPRLGVRHVNVLQSVVLSQQQRLHVRSVPERLRPTKQPADSLDAMVP